MVVKVKWFYHPEETRGGKKLHDMKVLILQEIFIQLDYLKQTLIVFFLSRLILKAIWGV